MLGHKSGQSRRVGAGKHAPGYLASVRAIHNGDDSPTDDTDRDKIRLATSVGARRRTSSVAFASLGTRHNPPSNLVMNG